MYVNPNWRQVVYCLRAYPGFICIRPLREIPSPPAPPGWELNPLQVTLSIHLLLTDSQYPFMPLGGERVLRVKLPNEITRSDYE